MELADQINYILSPLAIKDRSEKIYQLTLEGKTHFTWNEEKIDDVSSLVYQTIKKNYPDFKIPFHSRWRHFNVGGVDRLKVLDEKLKPLSPKEKPKSKLDLVFISVLLDAGAGSSWSYKDPFDGKEYNRS